MKFRTSIIKLLVIYKEAYKEAGKKQRRTGIKTRAIT